MVQLEVLLAGRWQAVRRYDTAHGFAHYDLLHADGQIEKIPLAFYDFNDALTFAEAELRACWASEAQRYIMEGRKHG